MSPLMLYVEDLTVIFSGFKALNSLNFYMGYGELRFLIGPNGAGKTTLLDVLCGKVKPAAGRITFRDKIQIPRYQEHELVAKGISRKFQAPSIFPSFTASENLDLSTGRNKRVLPTLLGAGYNAASSKEKINQVLEDVWLIDKAKVKAGILSHGEKQRLEIAMMLVQEPELLLLDEPVAGLTNQEKERMGELLQKISRQTSCLVVEHDMQFVRHYAQRVTVMHEGKVLAEGNIDQVQSNPQVMEVYLGRKEAAAC